MGRLNAVGIAVRAKVRPVHLFWLRGMKDSRESSVGKVIELLPASGESRCRASLVNQESDLGKKAFAIIIRADISVCRKPQPETRHSLWYALPRTRSGSFLERFRAIGACTEAASRHRHHRAAS